MMLKKRSIWLWIVLLGMGMLLVSCGDDDDDDNDLAPANIHGKTYQVIVTSGVSPLANTGTATVAFAADGTYTVTGDGNIANDQGNYTYAKVTDDSGDIVLTSTLIPDFQVRYTFSFTQENAGNFTAFLVSDPAITQEGSFSEL